MFSKGDLARELEKALVDGFSVSKLSKVAFEMYQEHGLELSQSMDRVLLVLMAMDEGKEFELSESEVLELIAELRSI